MKRLTHILVALLVAFAAGPALAGGALAADSTGVQSPALQLGDEVDCEFPVEVTDGTGETVTVEEEPEEIVVIAPNVAQHAWEIGIEDRVTGLPIDPATAYLDGREDKTDVTGDDGFPVEEEIVALEPDLVVADDVNDEELVERLRENGLTVYQYPQMETLEAMYGEVETLGQMTGNFEEAAAVTASTAGKVGVIEDAIADEDRPTVYYEFFGWTTGTGTLEDNLITRAGGHNIATEAEDSGYFELSEEIIAEEDPEWLVLQDGAPMPESEAVQSSTAVEQDQIVRVNPNFISQHGPRNIEPLRVMAESFHADALDGVDIDGAGPVEASQCAAVETPEPTPTETPEPTPTETPTDADDEPADPVADDDDDGTGFTVVVPAVAVIGLALFARLRE